MTSKYKHKLPTPKESEAANTTWTYYVSRDALDGALSTMCSLWHVKPLRTRIGTRVTWVGENGHLGNFRVDEIVAWFRTYPETDRELIVIETRPSASELEESLKKATP